MIFPDVITPRLRPALGEYLVKKPPHELCWAAAARLQNMLGPTHIGEVARGAGTPRSGGAAERRLDGIAYVAPREQFL